MNDQLRTMTMTTECDCIVNEQSPIRVYIAVVLSKQRRMTYLFQISDNEPVDSIGFSYQNLRLIVIRMSLL